METNKLAELRQELVAKIEEIATQGNVPPSTRISALMQIIRDGRADLNLYQRALETTDLIEDEQDRLNSYLDLLYEVDFASAATEVEQNAEVHEGEATQN